MKRVASKIKKMERIKADETLKIVAIGGKFNKIQIPSYVKRQPEQAKVVSEKILM
jgi:predicted metal-dependent phosphotriesterase family hydrolase